MPQTIQNVIQNWNKKSKTQNALVSFIEFHIQLVFYLESCESGSMFLNLPDDISIYATTAAGPNTSSYACYYDEKLGTYLGDVYSVKWMEDSDQVMYDNEPLQKWEGLFLTRNFHLSTDIVTNDSAPV